MTESVDPTTSSSAEASSATIAPPPLVLKKGTRIQHGFRIGKVEAVRGRWIRPYDVRVRWEGEKYPVYISFETLELDHAQGRLKLL